jgi:hypothetical protein
MAAATGASSASGASTLANKSGRFHAHQIRHTSCTLQPRVQLVLRAVLDRRLGPPLHICPCLVHVSDDLRPRRIAVDGFGGGFGFVDFEMLRSGPPGK